SVASVENTTSPSCGTDRIASLGGTAQYGRQRPWPLVHRPEQGPFCWAFQRLLQIARSPNLDRNALAQLLEPPCTDPYARWCGRGGAERLPPIPIHGTNATNPTHVPASALRGRPEMVGAQLNRREWSRPSASPTVCLVSRAKLNADPATSPEGRRLAIPNMRIDPANSSSRPPAIPRGAGSAYGGSMIPSTGGRHAVQDERNLVAW